jgi:histidine triad (HIT) family protein
MTALHATSEDCIFCKIVARKAPASIILETELILAGVDLRQHSPGHALVMPRAHIRDVRDLDDATGAALMAVVTRVSKAVSTAFGNCDLTLWHSIGANANQEVPHLHIHIHPRWPNDRLFELYPAAPLMPDRATLDAYAERIRAAL